MATVVALTCLWHPIATSTCLVRRRPRDYGGGRVTVCIWQTACSTTLLLPHPLQSRMAREGRRAPLLEGLVQRWAGRGFLDFSLGRRLTEEWVRDICMRDI